MGVSDDDKHCYVRVEDSGVGIPQSKLSEIFERFSQADNARGAYYQGTGIGLALSKEIISLHHGEICRRVLKGKEQSLPLNCNWVRSITNRRKSISIWAGKR